MASYSGILVDAPHRAEDTLRCSATIVAMSMDPVTIPPEDIESVVPIAQSTWDNQLPVSMPENDYVGTKVDSFLDDYYYRIHLSPAEIDFGPIVNPVDEEFIVWNAWFSSKLCSDMDYTEADEFSLAGSTAPFNLVALEWETYTVTVTEEGSTEFTATITFAFPGEEPVLTMTGMRVAVFPFAPSLPMMESLEWLTNIMRSRDGSEQRMSIRSVPRQGFKFDVALTDEQEQARLDALMFQWLKRTWAIPVWGEWEIHEADIDAGDTVISLDTTKADFRDDSYAIIWQASGLYESVKITTVAAGSITLDVPVISNWCGRKWIMPLRIGYMLSPTEKGEDADGFGKFGCSFLIRDNVLIDTYSAPVTYGGLPVLQASLEEGGLDNAFDGDIGMVDYGLGKFDFFSDSNFNIYVRRYVVRKEGKAAIWEFREFLHSLYGRRGTCWIVSDKADFELTTTIGAADVNFNISAVGWARHMDLNDIRTHLAFVFPSGAIYFREITGLTQSGDEDIVSIDSALGIEIEPGDCDICLMDKYRLTEDKVELEWQEPFSLICRTKFTRVKA